MWRMLDTQESEWTFNCDRAGGYYQDAMHSASVALSKVQQTFCLGSGNTQPSCYVERLDAYRVFPGVAGRNRSLDALLDINVQGVAKERISVAREVLGKVITSTEDMPPKVRRRTVRETMTAISHDSRVGNCDELTTFAFLALLKMEKDFSVEVVMFKETSKKVFFNNPLDHMFLVLNRNYSTDISRWQTWNPTAVILDPWLGFSYSPAEFARIWQDYQMEVPPALIKIVKKFDAKEYMMADQQTPAQPRWTSLQNVPIPPMGNSVASRKKQDSCAIS